MDNNDREAIISECRKAVALGIKAGKSNRALGKELDTDERTIRNDRKFLAIPEESRPAKVVKPKKVRPPKRRPAQSPMNTVLKIAQAWLIEQQLGFGSIEYVLEAAPSYLYGYRPEINKIPDPSLTPAELLSHTEPKQFDFDPDNPARNEDYHALWLARWLAACFPRDDHKRTEILKRISARVRENLSHFLYGRTT
jgi:hypothetical protein